MPAHKGYTPDDYRPRADAGMTFSEAARDMGVALSAVHYMARAHGITFTPSKPGQAKPRQAKPRPAATPFALARDDLARVRAAEAAAEARLAKARAACERAEAVVAALAPLFQED